MVSVEGGVEELVLPLGYKFHPTDLELVVYYLKNKVLGLPLPADIIPTFDVYSCSPYQLPLSNFKYGRKNEWYFFSTGRNGNILTNDGYYTVLNAEEKIGDENEVVGFVRTLAFHSGKLSKRTESVWIIREYKVNPNSVAVSNDDNTALEKIQNLVACKIFRVPRDDFELLKASLRGQ